MREIYSDIIQFRGSYFDFGFMQGERLKNSLTIINREKQWKTRKPRFSINVEETKQMITRFAPSIWEELLGLQEALKWSLEKVLQEFGGYRVNYYRSGCSIFTGKNFLIRNYDYHPKTYEGRYTIFQPTDGKGYAIIGPSQRITGRMDGLNEKGLAMGYNFMNRKQPEDGFVCFMIGRMILQSCANVEEAVEMLREIPHRHSFSYIIYDKSGRTYIVETSPRRVEVRQSNICTNHFEIMTEENRHHLVDSMRRMEIIEHNSSEMIDGYEAFRLFNDADKGVFSKLYSSWAGTIHTSVYFPQEMKVWFALGHNQEPTEINFAQWLAGEDLNQQRIFGTVETDVPFLYLDEGADWVKR
ncbi:C45 family autoproteolytic acyltransferase/hydolase [Bacillus kwashiorkori]|uniref:C45 family autoproteolytic acyltransferase/hydolase n=1 Tax=Bacillus kwashiorkori TaxID=1522318 RepID=UPI0007802104|nr:C45 family peptidase [Bacillus kwashiorkori]